MARHFVKNLSHLLRLGNNALNPLLSGASAVSLHGWLWGRTFDTGANDNRLLNVMVNGGLAGVTLMVSATRTVRAGGRSQSGDSFQAASGTSPLPLGVWVAAGGVLDFANDRIRVYRDGRLEADTAVSFGAATYTPGTGTTQDALGASGVVTADQFEGRLARLSVWKSDIGSHGFLRLCRGLSPRWIDPTNLVAYWQLRGSHSPEVDEVSAKHATITGSIPVGLDPPQLLPITPWPRRRSFYFWEPPPPPPPGAIFARRGQALRTGSRGLWRD